VLCSSAARTKETWEAAAPELGAMPETEFLDALYDAPEAAILKCVQGAANGAAAVLIIGHNPGIERFARMLIRKPENADERRRGAALGEKFPTSALAVIDFNVRAWANIAAGKGLLTDFICPADLKNK
jgi:phosphohistidine phosphatase